MQTAAGVTGQVKVVEGGDKRRGEKMDITHKRQRENVFLLEPKLCVYLLSDIMHIVVCRTYCSACVAAFGRDM